MGCLAIALFIVQNDNLKLFSGNFVSRKKNALDIREIVRERMKISKSVLSMYPLRLGYTQYAGPCIVASCVSVMFSIFHEQKLL